jgi:hypothetical protein
MVPVPIFETFLWLLFILALVDGFRRYGLKNGFLFFIPAFVYGWLLEESAITIFQRYYYSPDFLLSYRDAPFSVAAGWATILYSGIVISEYLSLSRFKTALFVALWGLCIDFSMDALAVRFTYWTWTFREYSFLPYFNVPVSNFIAWFICLFLFTYFHLLGRNKRYRSLFLGFDATLPSVPLLMFGCFLLVVVPYERIFYNLTWWQMIIIMPLPVMIGLSLWLSKLNDLRNKSNLIPLVIMESFHVFFIISSFYVWIATGIWAYVIAAAIPLLPVITYNARSMILSKKVQLQPRQIQEAAEPSGVE